MPRVPYAYAAARAARERVAFTADLERRVLRAMAEMRAALATGRAPDPEWVAPKCGACGYAPICWDGAPAFSGA